MCGRFLADLGADVIRVEPPGGAASRAQAPLHEGVSLRFADAQRGQAQRRRRPRPTRTVASGCCGLLDRADIWIETARPGRSVGARARRRASSARGTPRLVVLSITDFGQTGPYRDWVATDWTLLAMGGVLSRSGLPGREPLMPPGETWRCRSRRCRRRGRRSWRTGTGSSPAHGDHIDFSLYEATAQVDRPGDGDRGHRAGRRLRATPATARRPARTRSSAAATATCGSSSWRRASGTRCARGSASRRSSRTPSSRRSAGGRSPSEPAARGLRAALPRARQARADARGPGARRADRAGADARRRARGRALPRPRRDRSHASSRAGSWPTRRRASPRSTAGACAPARRAPGVGEHDDEVFAEPRPRAARGGAPTVAAPRRPLEGLRVLDFGVIVLGAEAAPPVLRPGRRGDQDREPGVSRRRARLARALRDRPSRQQERRREPAQPRRAST